MRSALQKHAQVVSKKLASSLLARRVRPGDFRLHLRLLCPRNLLLLLPLLPLLLLLLFLFLLRLQPLLPPLLLLPLFLLLLLTPLLPYLLRARPLRLLP